MTGRGHGASPSSNRRRVIEALPSSGVDLERREDRFVILPGDIAEVERRLLQETRLVEYPDSPITRTLYLGGPLGALPALTFKARTYAPSRLDALWTVGSDEEFSLLEVKRSVPDPPDARPEPVFDAGPVPVRCQEAWRFVRHAPRSFSGRGKQKVRTGRIRLREILDLLSGEACAVEGALPGFLDAYLEERRGAFHPLVGTEYRRRHFVVEAAGEREQIPMRATIDERITYYSFRPAGEGWVGTQVGQEEAASLEFKIAPTACPEAVARTIEGLVRDFLLFPVPSKKCRAVSAQSRWVIDRLALFNEIPEHRCEGSVEDPRGHARGADDLLDRCRSLRGFAHHGAEPTIVETHDSEVEGSRQGFRLRFSGRELTWELPPETRRDGPVVLSRRDSTPVGRIGIDSHLDLVSVAGPDISGLDGVYRRCRGVLVESGSSGRVYRVAFRREDRTVGGATRQVEIAYLGRVGMHEKLPDARPIEKEIVRIGRHFVT